MTALAAAARRTPARRRRDLHRRLWFVAFVGPFVLGLLLFTYIPVIWSVYLSFFDARNTVSPTALRSGL